MKALALILVLIFLAGCTQPNTLLFKQRAEEIDHIWLDEGFDRPFEERPHFSEIIEGFEQANISKLSTIRHRLYDVAEEVVMYSDENAIALLDYLELHLLLADMYSERWEFSHQKDLNEIIDFDNPFAGEKEMCSVLGDLRESKIRGEKLYIVAREINNKIDAFYSNHPSQANEVGITPMKKIILFDLSSWLIAIGDYISLLERTCIFNVKIEEWNEKFFLLLQLNPCENFVPLMQSIGEGEKLMQEQRAILLDFSDFYTKNQLMLYDLNIDLIDKTDSSLQKLSMIRQAAEAECIEPEEEQN